MPKQLPGRTGWALLLLLWGVLVVVSACGEQPHVQLPKATRTTAPTVTPDSTRIPYPWLMKQRQNGIGGTDWVPSDARVFLELAQDFLSYWDWSGQAGPPVFPFVPDQQQIVLLADAHFQASLSQYLEQVRSSNQVTAYLGADLAHPVLPLQRVQGCTQDGLQCLCLYTFNATMKTVYNARTGQVLSQTANINIVFEVTQSYNRGMQRWQLTDLLSQEFTP